MDLPPSVSRLVRVVPGEARTVIGLVSVFGLMLALAVGGLVWWDLTHPDASAPTVSEGAAADR